MGKTLRDEDLKLNIIINGDKGKKELGDLEQSTRELVNINKDLRVEKQKLEREGKKESDRYKEITKSINQNNATIKQNETRMKELRQQIGLTGLTMSQLRQEQKKLKSQLDNATYGTAQWKKLEIELKKVEAQMLKVKTGGQSMKQTMGRIGDGFNRFALMGASVVAALTGIILKIGSMIKGNADLSDSFADVQKTTGLTNSEVKSLYKTFRTFNTRTANKELLGLARIAGKLGIEGKKNVEGFVRAADQINVALGEDLGGNAEDAINHIGKIVDIFKVKEKFGLEEGMLKVGSAINALGAASTASEEYLVEFTKRVGGIAPNANISAADTLGLAATLDQLGQTAEVSSTVFGKLMVAIGQDIPKYAALANISIEEFKDLLAEDTNEALIKVLESAKSTTGGLEGMVESLEALGVDGQRSASVIGVLTNNVELLRQQQKLSNDEFEKGTSLTNEFNIKNENMAGGLDKITKRLYAAFVNGKILKGLESIVNKTAELIEIPVSDSIMKEQAAFNRLYGELLRTNSQTKERKELVEQLNKEYPDYTANIDLNKASEAELREELTLTNEQYLNRITLQLHQEKINKYAKDLAAKKINYAEVELEVSNKVYDVARKKKLLDEIAGKTTQEQIDLLRQLTGKHFLLNEAEQDLYRATNDLSTAQLTYNYELAKSNKLLESYNIKTGKKETPVTSKPTKPTSDKSPIIKEEDIQKALLELRRKYGLIGTRELYLQELQEFIDNEASKLLSAEQYLKALQEIRDKYFPEIKLDPFPDEETVEDESTYLVQKYQQTLEGRKALLDAQLEAEIISYTEYKDKIALLDQETLYSKMRTSDAWIETLNNTADIAGSIFRIAAENEIKNSKATDEEKKKIEKKWALRQAILSSGLVLIEGLVELARINSNAAVNADLTQTLRAALSAAAITRTIASEAAIWSNYAASSNFWTGGHTGPGRKYEKKGNVHANEYVVNQEGMQDPVISNFISSYVEPKRLRSLNYSGLNQAINYTRGYATGGGVGFSQPVTNNINVDNSELKGMFAQMMALMEAKLNRPAIAFIPDSTSRDIRDKINEFNSIESGP